ncbi:MAG: ChaN family lipoprotein [Planctomycetota bacterium]|jgi:uncharacterized iron-regulated protein
MIAITHRTRSTRRLALLFAPAALWLAGCATFPPLPDAEPVAARQDLPMFDGTDGARLDWASLLDRIDEADVIVIGEQHDDNVGHGFQRAVVVAMVERWPETALSMEMLDRREQSVADDYLADLIDRPTFIEQTAATRWRRITRQYIEGEIDSEEFHKRITRMGWPEWERTYQPIIDAVKAGGGTVVAANAPWALYTKKLSDEDDDDEAAHDDEDGDGDDEHGDDDGDDDDDDDTDENRDPYAGLLTLTPAQRALIEIPPEVPPDGRYRERFWDVMAGRAEGEEPEPDDDEDAGEDGGGMAVHRMVTDEQVLSAFHSQLLYDATMAASIVEAKRAGAEKVVHLVGHFHSDFEGGTVLFVRQMDPSLRVLVISMQTEGDGTALREDEEDCADVVVYTRASEPDSD